MKRLMLGLVVAVGLVAPAAAFAASVSIQALSGSSVQAGGTVSFSASANGFSSPTYLVSDSFSGTSITSAAIGSDGSFSWTASTTDIGTHNLTVRVQDSIGNNASAAQTIVVTAQPSFTIVSLSPGLTLAAGQNLSFQALASGYGAPTYTVSDTFASSTLTSKNLSNSGYFAWMPAPQDAGAHTITVSGSDPAGHSGSATLIVVVTTVPQVVLVGSVAQQAVVGSTLHIHFGAYGLQSPNFIIRDSNPASSLTSTTTDASGDFYWAPQPKDVGGHTLIVSALDNNGHSANLSLSVVVSAASTTPQTQTTPAQPAHASGLSQTQIQAILSLLSSFGADQGTISNVSAALGGSAGGSSSNSSSGATFVSFLDIGSSGAEVTALQQKLISLGFFSGSATGYFGPLTAAAVKAFQAGHGVSAVGYVGPSTRAALNQ